MSLRGKTILDDMKMATLQVKSTFSDDEPLFTVAYIKEEQLKMSFISGFLELKYFFEDLDPDTIDLRAREFENFGDVWTLEVDGEPYFILKNNQELKRGQMHRTLKRIGFAS
jgi:hypothetical protein